MMTSITSKLAALCAQVDDHNVAGIEMELAENPQSVNPQALVTTWVETGLENLFHYCINPKVRVEEFPYCQKPTFHLQKDAEFEDWYDDWGREQPDNSSKWAETTLVIGTIAASALAVYFVSTKIRDYFSK